MRSQELADSHTGLLPVLQWVLKQYDAEGEIFNDIFCLTPTAPLVVAEDLQRGWNMYMKHNKVHPLHVVASYPVPIEWAYRRDSQGLLTPVAPGAFEIRSQDLEAAFYETGPFTILHRSHILGEKPLNDEGFVSITMPRDRAVDIDESEDLKLAETLYLGMLVLQKFDEEKLCQLWRTS